MIVICAWCKTVKGEKEPFEDKQETHGICIPCKEKHFMSFQEIEIVDLMKVVKGVLQDGRGPQLLYANALIQSSIRRCYAVGCTVAMVKQAIEAAYLRVQFEREQNAK